MSGQRSKKRMGSSRRKTSNQKEKSDPDDGILKTQSLSTAEHSVAEESSESVAGFAEPNDSQAGSQTVAEVTGNRRKLGSSRKIKDRKAVKDSEMREEVYDNTPSKEELFEKSSNSIPSILEMESASYQEHDLVQQPDLCYKQLDHLENLREETGPENKDNEQSSTLCSNEMDTVTLPPELIPQHILSEQRENREVNKDNILEQREIIQDEETIQDESKWKTSTVTIADARQDEMSQASEHDSSVSSSNVPEDSLKFGTPTTTSCTDALPECLIPKSEEALDVDGNDYDNKLKGNDPIVQFQSEEVSDDVETYSSANVVAQLHQPDDAIDMHDQVTTQQPGHATQIQEIEPYQLEQLVKSDDQPVISDPDNKQGEDGATKDNLGLLYRGHETLSREETSEPAESVDLKDQCNIQRHNINSSHKEACQSDMTHSKPSDDWQQQYASSEELSSQSRQRHFTLYSSQDNNVSLKAESIAFEATVKREVERTQIIQEDKSLSQIAEENTEENYSVLEKDDLSKSTVEASENEAEHISESEHSWASKSDASDEHRGHQGILDQHDKKQNDENPQIKSTGKRRKMGSTRRLQPKKAISDQGATMEFDTTDVNQMRNQKSFEGELNVISEPKYNTSNTTGHMDLTSIGSDSQSHDINTSHNEPMDTPVEVEPLDNTNYDKSETDSTNMDSTLYYSTCSYLLDEQDEDVTETTLRVKSELEEILEVVEVQSEKTPLMTLSRQNSEIKESFASQYHQDVDASDQFDIHLKDNTESMKVLTDAVDGASQRKDVGNNALLDQDSPVMASTPKNDREQPEEENLGHGRDEKQKIDLNILEVAKNVGDAIMVETSPAEYQLQFDVECKYDNSEEQRQKPCEAVMDSSHLSDTNYHEEDYDKGSPDTAEHVSEPLDNTNDDVEKSLISGVRDSEETKDDKSETDSINMDSTLRNLLDEQDEDVTETTPCEIKESFASQYHQGVDASDQFDIHLQDNTESMKVLTGAVGGASHSEDVGNNALLDQDSTVMASTSKNVIERPEEENLVHGRDEKQKIDVDVSEVAKNVGDAIMVESPAEYQLQFDVECKYDESEEQRQKPCEAVMDSSHLSDTNYHEEDYDKGSPDTAEHVSEPLDNTNDDVEKSLISGVRDSEETKDDKSETDSINMDSTLRNLLDEQDEDLTETTPCEIKESFASQYHQGVDASDQFDIQLQDNTESMKVLTGAVGGASHSEDVGNNALLDQDSTVMASTSKNVIGRPEEENLVHGRDEKQKIDVDVSEVAKNVGDAIMVESPAEYQLQFDVECKYDESEEQRQKPCEAVMDSSHLSDTKSHEEDYDKDSLDTAEHVSEQSWPSKSDASDAQTGHQGILDQHDKNQNDENPQKTSTGKRRKMGSTRRLQPKKAISDQGATMELDTTDVNMRNQKSFEGELNVIYEPINNTSNNTGNMDLTLIGSDSQSHDINTSHNEPMETAVEVEPLDNTNDDVEKSLISGVRDSEETKDDTSKTDNINMDSTLSNLLDEQDEDVTETTLRVKRESEEILEVVEEANALQSENTPLMTLSRPNSEIKQSFASQYHQGVDASDQFDIHLQDNTESMKVLTGAVGSASHSEDVGNNALPDQDSTVMASTSENVRERPEEENLVHGRDEKQKIDVDISQVAKNVGDAIMVETSPAEYQLQFDVECKYDESEERSEKLCEAVMDSSHLSDTKSHEEDYDKDSPDTAEHVSDQSWPSKSDASDAQTGHQGILDQHDKNQNDENPQKTSTGKRRKMGSTRRLQPKKAISDQGATMELDTTDVNMRNQKSFEGELNVIYEPINNTSNNTGNMDLTLIGSDSQSHDINTSHNEPMETAVEVEPLDNTNDDVEKSLISGVRDSEETKDDTSKTDNINMDSTLSNLLDEQDEDVTETTLRVKRESEEILEVVEEANALQSEKTPLMTLSRPNSEIKQSFASQYHQGVDASDQFDIHLQDNTESMKVLTGAVGSASHSEDVGNNALPDQDSTVMASTSKNVRERPEEENLVHGRDEKQKIDVDISQVAKNVGDAIMVETSPAEYQLQFDVECKYDESEERSEKLCEAVMDSSHLSDTKSHEEDSDKDSLDTAEHVSEQSWPSKSDASDAQTGHQGILDQHDKNQNDENPQKTSTGKRRKMGSTRKLQPKKAISDQGATMELDTTDVNMRNQKSFEGELNVIYEPKYNTSNNTGNMDLTLIGSDSQPHDINTSHNEPMETPVEVEPLDNTNDDVEKSLISGVRDSEETKDDKSETDSINMDSTLSNLLDEQDEDVTETTLRVKRESEEILEVVEEANALQSEKTPLMTLSRPNSEIKQSFASQYHQGVDASDQFDIHLQDNTESMKVLTGAVGSASHSEDVGNNALPDQDSTVMASTSKNVRERPEEENLVHGRDEKQKIDVDISQVAKNVGGAIMVETSPAEYQLQFDVECKYDESEERSEKLCEAVMDSSHLSDTKSHEEDSDKDSLDTAEHVSEQSWPSKSDASDAQTGHQGILDQHDKKQNDENPQKTSTGKRRKMGSTRRLQPKKAISDQGATMEFDTTDVNMGNQKSFEGELNVISKPKYNTSYTAGHMDLTLIGSDSQSHDNNASHNEPMDTPVEVEPLDNTKDDVEKSLISGIRDSEETKDDKSKTDSINMDSTLSNLLDEQDEDVIEITFRVKRELEDILEVVEEQKIDVDISEVAKNVGDAMMVETSPAEYQLQFDVECKYDKSEEHKEKPCEAVMDSSHLSETKSHEEDSDKDSPDTAEHVSDQSWASKSDASDAQTGHQGILDQHDKKQNDENPQIKSTGKRRKMGSTRRLQPKKAISDQGTTMEFDTTDVNMRNQKYFEGELNVISEPKYNTSNTAGHMDLTLIGTDSQSHDINTSHNEPMDTPIEVEPLDNQNDDDVEKSLISGVRDNEETKDDKSETDNINMDSTLSNPMVEQDEDLTETTLRVEREVEERLVVIDEANVPNDEIKESNTEEYLSDMRRRRKMGSSRRTTRFAQKEQKTLEDVIPVQEQEVTRAELSVQTEVNRASQGRDENALVDPEKQKQLQFDVQYKYDESEEQREKPCKAVMDSSHISDTKSHEEDYDKDSPDTAEHVSEHSWASKSNASDAHGVHQGILDQHDESQNDDNPQIKSTGKRRKMGSSRRLQPKKAISDQGATVEFDTTDMGNQKSFEGELNLISEPKYNTSNFTGNMDLTLIQSHDINTSHNEPMDTPVEVEQLHNTNDDDVEKSSINTTRNSEEIKYDDSKTDNINMDSTLRNLLGEQDEDVTETTLRLRVKRELVERLEVIEEGSGSQSESTEDLRDTRRRRKMGSSRRTTRFAQKEEKQLEDVIAVQEQAVTRAELSVQKKVNRASQDRDENALVDPEKLKQLQLDVECKYDESEEQREKPVVDSSHLSDPPSSPLNASTFERKRRKMGSNRKSQGQHHQGGPTKDEVLSSCDENVERSSSNTNRGHSRHGAFLGQEAPDQVTGIQHQSPVILQVHGKEKRHYMGSSKECDLGPRYDVAIVGNSYVGKTSFIKWVQNGTFSPDFSATIGIDTYKQSVTVNGKTVALTLWDTAGQERFRSITRQMFHKARAFLLMYDVTSSQSFSDVTYWLSCIQEGATEDVIIMLLGNKIDSAKREIHSHEGKALAKESNIEFMECSAATGENVTQSMETIARMLSQRFATREEGMVLRKEPQQKKSSGCC